MRLIIFGWLMLFTLIHQQHLLGQINLPQHSYKEIINDNNLLITGDFFISPQGQLQRVFGLQKALSALNPNSSFELATTPSYADMFATLCTQPQQTQSFLNLHLDLGEDYEIGNHEFSVKLKLSIQAKDQNNNNVGAARTKTLYIDTDTPEELIQEDVSAELNGNAATTHHYEITILSLTASYGGNAAVIAYVANHLRLTSLVHHKYKVVDPFGPNQLVVLSPQVLVNKMLRFSWKHNGSGCFFMPKYQVQIQRVYEGSTVNWKNALSLEVSNFKQSIDVVLAEGTGKYVWRVRPISEKVEGGIANSENWGAWSINAPNQGEKYGNLNINNVEVFNYQQFDADRNFVLTQSYSENNQSHQQLSYLNQLGGAVQSQSRLGSKNSTILTQTVYDYVGRPVLNSLPTVDQNNDGELGFRSNVLEYNNEPLGPQHFDTDNTLYQSIALTGGLTHDYYSDNNADPTIPSADGFPYVRTMFQNDGTNTVKQSSKAGLVHQFGGLVNGAKNSFVFMNAASEEELIRLFGDEAPDTASVTKQIVVDENGMSRVQFLNHKGLILASCLVEKETPLSQSIDPMPTQTTMTPFSIGGFVPTANGLSATAEFTLVEPRQVEFSFEFFKNAFQLECSDYCATCDYQVDITLNGKDLDGGWQGTNSLLNQNYESDDCEEVTISLDKNDEGFTRQLTAGIYSIQATFSPVVQTDYLDIHTTAVQEELKELWKDYLQEDFMGQNATLSELIDGNDMDGLNSYLFTASDNNPNVSYSAENKEFTIELDNCHQLTIPHLACFDPCVAGENVDLLAYITEFANIPDLAGGEGILDYGNFLGRVPEVDANGEIRNYIRYVNKFNSDDYSELITFFNNVKEDVGCAIAWTALDRTISAYNTSRNSPQQANHFDFVEVFVQEIRSRAKKAGIVLPYGVSSIPYGIPGYLSDAHIVFECDLGGAQDIGCFYNFEIDGDGVYTTLTINELTNTRHSQNNEDRIAAWEQFKSCYRSYQARTEMGFSSDPATYNDELLELIGQTHQTMVDTCQKLLEYKLPVVELQIRAASGTPILVEQGPVEIEIAGVVLNEAEIDCKVAQFYEYGLEQCQLDIYYHDENGNSFSTTSLEDVLLLTASQIDSVGSREQQEFLRNLMFGVPEIRLFPNEAENNGNNSIQQAPDCDGIFFSEQNVQVEVNLYLADFENLLWELMEASIEENQTLTRADLDAIVSEQLGQEVNGFCEDVNIDIFPSSSYSLELRADVEGGGCPQLYLIETWTEYSSSQQGFHYQEFLLCKNFCYQVNDTCSGFCLSFHLPLENVEVPSIETYDCQSRNVLHIAQSLERQQQILLGEVANRVASTYQQNCWENLEPKLTYAYPLAYSHYTLYYYDRMGRLIRTVSPKGVEMVNQRIDTDHDFQTNYVFNSLGQIISDDTPDGGMSLYIYDDLERSRFTQTAQQTIDKTYSYVKYDHIGRSVESGKAKLAVGQQFQDLEALAADLNFPANNTEEVVWSFYNTPKDAQINYQGQTPRFLQNQLSYTKAQTDLGFVYTHYSYDPHGNVEWLIREIPGMNRSISVAYTYDLISSKITQIAYNKGQEDAFFYRYTYDADNRLLTAETSSNGAIWDQDVRLEYHLHGPLKRKEFGEDKLQGEDYVYAINGQLKAQNHRSLDASKDPGQDGDLTKSRFGKDLFGMQMFYYEGDFTRNGAFEHTNNQPFIAEAKSLYNGLVAGIQYSNTNSDGQLVYQKTPTANLYKYDQLYRLSKSEFAYESNNQFVISKDYLTTIAYDLNGNIINLNRNAHGDHHQMDKLTYHYHADNNRLSYIDDDAQQAVDWLTDLKDQDSKNYRYDANGQLLADDAENISSIEWTATGKVKKVTKTDGTILRFNYDEKDSRLSKSLEQGKQLQETTYYVSLPSGVQAIYRYDHLTEKLTWESQSLAAAGRVGVYQAKQKITGQAPVDNGLYTREIGKKQYELTDHLDNVRASFSDRKLANLDPLGQVKSLTADLSSLQNYYAFGMQMPGMQFNSSDYRYGFNGKEKDNELKGEGNSYDFHARFYDPRVARWLSTDPLEAKFPSVSTYSAMANNPVMFVDPDGKAPEGVCPVSPNTLIDVEANNSARIVDAGFSLPDPAEILREQIAAAAQDDLDGTPEMSATTHERQQEQLYRKQYEDQKMHKYFQTYNAGIQNPGAAAAGLIVIAAGGDEDDIAAGVAAGGLMFSAIPARGAVTNPAPVSIGRIVPKVVLKDPRFLEVRVTQQAVKLVNPVVRANPRQPAPRVKRAESVKARMVRPSDPRVPLGIRTFNDLRTRYNQATEKARTDYRKATEKARSGYQSFTPSGAR